MIDRERKSMESISNEVHAFLTALSPAQAKALRAQFEAVGPVAAQQEARGRVTSLTPLIAPLQSVRASRRIS
jgi:hypothetical protein